MAGNRIETPVVEYVELSSRNEEVSSSIIVIDGKRPLLVRIAMLVPSVESTFIE